MIDIQETALRSLEQDALAVIAEAFEDLRNIGCDRRDDLRVTERFIERLCKVHGFRTEIFPEQKVVIIEYLTQLGSKFLTNEQVRHAQRAP